jgi:hypothetical protein
MFIDQNGLEDFSNSLSTMGASPSSAYNAGNGYGKGAGPDLTMLGGGFKAASDLMAGNTSARLLRANAAIAGTEAQSEYQKGAEETNIYQQHLDQTIGKMTASVGGSGITMSGSPLRALQSTAMIGAQDMQRIQLNASRAAWGFQTTQAGDLVRANLAKAAGDGNAVGSLISSSARAYGQWNQD